MTPRWKQLSDKVANGGILDDAEAAEYEDLNRRMDAEAHASADDGDPPEEGEPEEPAEGDPPSVEDSEPDAPEAGADGSVRVAERSRREVDPLPQPRARSDGRRLPTPHRKGRSQVRRPGAEPFGHYASEAPADERPGHVLADTFRCASTILRATTDNRTFRQARDRFFSRMAEHWQNPEAHAAVPDGAVGAYQEQSAIHLPPEAVAALWERLGEDVFLPNHSIPYPILGDTVKIWNLAQEERSEGRFWGGPGGGVRIFESEEGGPSIDDASKPSLKAHLLSLSRISSVGFLTHEAELFAMQPTDILVRAMAAALRSYINGRMFSGDGAGAFKGIMSAGKHLKVVPKHASQAAGKPHADLHLIEDNLFDMDAAFLDNGTFGRSIVLYSNTAKAKLRKVGAETPSGGRLYENLMEIEGHRAFRFHHAKPSGEQGDITFWNPSGYAFAYRRFGDSLDSSIGYHTSMEFAFPKGRYLELRLWASGTPTVEGPVKTEGGDQVVEFVQLGKRN